jgi:hypothetical protein
MKYFAFFLLAISLKANAQDSTRQKTSWHMTGSLGFNMNHVRGSMQDYTEKWSAQFPNSTPEQKNGGGFQFATTVQKDVGNWLYLKSGFGLVQKNVNPEENTYILYKDSLNTGYIFIPVLIGAQTFLDSKRTISLFCETGILTNFAISDQTYSGPDRVDFSRSSVVATYQISAGIGYVVGSNATLILQYAYSMDVSPAYKETLYYGAPNQKFLYGDYKYHTSSLSLGLKMGLHS